MQVSIATYWYFNHIFGHISYVPNEGKTYRDHEINYQLFQAECQLAEHGDKLYGTVAQPKEIKRILSYFRYLDPAAIVYASLPQQCVRID